MMSQKKNQKSKLFKKELIVERILNKVRTYFFFTVTRASIRVSSHIFFSQMNSGNSVSRSVRFINKLNSFSLSRSLCVSRQIGVYVRPYG